MTDFWRLFLGFFFKSGFGDVGRCRASEGPAAVVRRMGGGIPLDIPGEGIERKFHTPAAGLRPGAADLKASPCRRPSLVLQVSSLDAPVGTCDVDNGVCIFGS